MFWTCAVDPGLRAVGAPGGAGRGGRLSPRWRSSPEGVVGGTAGGMPLWAPPSPPSPPSAGPYSMAHTQPSPESALRLTMWGSRWRRRASLSSWTLNLPLRPSEHVHGGRFTAAADQVVIHEQLCWIAARLVGAGLGAGRHMLAGRRSDSRRRPAMARSRRARRWRGSRPCS